MKYGRIYFLLFVVLLLGSGVLARLFSLQILQYDYYNALAQGQQQIYEELFPKRGEILMQDLSVKRRTGQDKYYPLAINKEFQQVYIVPKNILQDEKEKLSEILSSFFDLDREVILTRMNKADDPYEPIKHKVEQQTAQQIEELSFNGVVVAPESWRYYPNNSLACHLLGFVGMDGEKKVGQYGLEGYYENELKGKVGFLSGGKDTSGYWIPSLAQELKPAEDGAKLVLTIDQNIQFKAEKELRQLVERWQAESGIIIIMEPKTGAVRAMANEPRFNPNEYNKIEDINIFLNSSIQEAYEPGSVFKPITMAIGLDSGRITSETTYQDKGQTAIKKTIITNVDGKAYGEQNMTQVLEKSLNTGAVFIQQKIGQDIFQDYIQEFGFHQLTGVDLAGEVSGNIANLFTGREINLANIAFGQGITVTPLGLITSIGAIANDGKILQPFVVEKIINSDGTEIVREPKIIKQIISSQTAQKLTKMLVSVVENGYGKPARVSGYSIAGKTGTAQVPDLEEGGYSDETIHSFIGYAPAFNPEFIILIKLDNPQGIRFAADSVGPVFRKIAEYLFNYLEIPPA